MKRRNASARVDRFDGVYSKTPNHYLCTPIEMLLAECAQPILIIMEVILFQFEFRWVLLIPCPSLL